MGYRTWVYHRTEKAKIIDSDELAAHFAQGWADTPAAFTKGVPDVAPQEVRVVLAPATTTEAKEYNPREIGGIVLQPDDEMRADIATKVPRQVTVDEIDGMSKRQLDEYADKEFGIKLDRRMSKEKMVDAFMEALTNGNSPNDNK